MPLYEFVCGVCGNIREIVQSFYAEPPICCGKPMKRKFSVPQPAIMKDSIRTIITDNLQEGLPDAPNKKILEKKIMSGFKDKPAIWKGF